jgi:hypothetical protein
MGGTASAKRTDQRGRAFAGSQLQVQIYVSRKPDVLSEAVSRALAACGKNVPSVRWTAPLEAELFKEPFDRAFLVALGLEDAAEALRQFWPSGGPNWDALAVLGNGARRDGVLLIEAKSYPEEVHGSGCQATNQKSIETIERSLLAAQKWFGATTESDWTGRLYQYANRLAHVYFLRQELGVDAWLVNLCFTDDMTTRPTTAEHWEQVLPTFKRDLGFVGKVPWVLDVLLPAHQRSDLI